MARKTTAAGTLAGRYFDLLSEEGYRPRLEPTGDRTSTVAFKAEGLTFVLLVDEDDEDFLGLGLSYGLGEVDDRATSALRNAAKAFFEPVRSVEHLDA